MPTITIDLTDAEYEQIVQKTKELGFITMQSYLKNVILGSKGKQNFLQEAQKRAKTKPKGKVFIVKELFLKDEWGQLTDGEKRRLGYDFFKEYSNHNLIDEGKNTSNSQQYSNK